MPAIEIKQLAQKYGWAEDSWQVKLLNAADQATRPKTATDKKGDGKVSVHELDSYLKNPEDAQFLSSATIDELMTALPPAPADPAAGGVSTGRKIRALKKPWQQKVATRADKSGKGNQDGELTATEFRAYLQEIKAYQDRTLNRVAERDVGGTGTEPNSVWLPEQRLAALASRISRMTGEPDSLRPKAGNTGATELIKEYMTLGHDDSKRVPMWVSYLLTASDIKERVIVERTDDFRADGELGTKAATPKDYLRTGYDMGHQKPAGDSPDLGSMVESFLLSNMSPQAPNLNRQGWRMLELAVRELVEGTGGKAVVVTGNLFLDENERALPADKISWIGRDGSHNVAVPTHCFKAVLLEQPNGHLTMLGFILPNDPKLPTKKEDIAALLQKSRRTVDDIERLVGADLFAHLPEKTQKRLEADRAAVVKVLDETRFEAISLLWPKTAPKPAAWKAPANAQAPAPKPTAPKPAAPQAPVPAADATRIKP